MFGDAAVRGGKPCAQIRLGCLYDALNRTILNASCSRIKFNGMAVAKAQIKKVRGTIGDLPFLVTMDRGYPSMPAFLRMIDDGTYFVARLKSSDFKAEQQAWASDDEDMDIRLTKSRRRHYIGTGEETLVMSRESFPLRIQSGIQASYNSSYILFISSQFFTLYTEYP